jgi:LEA14-like dessication related protein
MPTAIRRVALLALVCAAVAACAGLGLREPLRVNLAGLESLPGEGLEARFLARIRVQNPNDVAIAYSGLSAELDLNGRSFASGVSAATGEIPRFGESVLELPLTVPATAIVRQVLGFISGDRGKATYRIRGFLNTGTFGRASFDSTGDIELPTLAPAGN